MNISCLLQVDKPTKITHFSMVPLRQRISTCHYLSLDQPLPFPQKENIEQKMVSPSIQPASESKSEVQGSRDCLKKRKMGLYWWCCIAPHSKLLAQTINTTGGIDLIRAVAYFLSLPKHSPQPTNNDFQFTTSMCIDRCCLDSFFVIC